MMKESPSSSSLPVAGLSAFEDTDSPHAVAAPLLSLTPAAAHPLPVDLLHRGLDFSERAALLPFSSLHHQVLASEHSTSSQEY